MNYKLSNQWGGTMTYCAKHLSSKRQYLEGLITEETTSDPCPDCAYEDRWAAAPGEMLAALQDPKFSHTRFRFGAVYAYHRAPESPSGVLLVAGLDPERYEELCKTHDLRGLKRSPLSPTEGFRGQE